MMEIRGAKETETGEIIDMLCLAFRPTGRLRYEKHLKLDSSYKPHQSRVGVISGKIVSYVRVSDRPVRVGSCVVRMGGVGAVATHPDHRGKGYNTAVLKDSIDYMDEQGYQVSMLFTGIHQHYAKVGWAPFPEHTSSVKLRSRIPSRPDRPERGQFIIRDYQDKDLDQVIEVYDDHNRCRTLTLVRSPQYWRDEYSAHMGVLPSYVLEENGTVLAYLNCTTRGNEVVVSEMGYKLERPDVLKPLAHFLIESTLGQELDAIMFHLPRSHPFPEIVSEQCRGNITHYESEGMMLRLINLPSLLRQIAPELRARLKRGGMSSARARFSLSAAEHRAIVEVERGNIDIRDGQLKEDHIALDMRRLCRLLFGDMTAGELSELNAAKGLSLPDELVAILDALFPPQNPYYWGCDHF